ncbi:GNAT family N-acetyltransferase [Streptacidiphilus fuscans]|uniref:GNAT family N-acetyltransferase n=1 Tax=Streptacidiphilus fuscans TaxID=2789292 RepID=A0A931AZV3_9ACTN|nr:GNAT family N-acetyltransferase [Streptacidiphilus fuscans]MBF9066532.1 GNAT family N-acetyltransferase [Streptacidiphilus fuscans]
MPTSQAVVSPAPRSEWNRLLAGDPASSVFQTPAWFDAVIRLTGGRDASRLYTTGDGRRLLLPLVRRSLIPGIVFDAAYPHRMGPGGLLATGGLRPEDVDLVLSDVLLARTPGVRIAAMHDVTDRWEQGLALGAAPRVDVVRAHVHVLDLDGGFARVRDDRFHASTRKNVRKAERSGLTVERDVTGRLVPAFYDVYLRWSAERARKSGLPWPLAAALARRREPLPMFETLATSLDGACRLWLARYDGEPVAGLMTFVHGEHGVSFRSYAVKEFASLRAGLLLQRAAIEDACDQGCRFYSMGMSGGVRGIEVTKEAMGATPRTVLECRRERLPFTRLEHLGSGMESTAARILARLRGDHRAEPGSLAGVRE